MRRSVWTMFAVVAALWLVGALRFPWAGAASTANSGLAAGSLIKGALPAVYYFSADGKRYVFPNEKTYRTWYSDFTGIRTVDAATLAAISIGGNVTYRPGIGLVKVVSDPKVYAVARGGVLRHVRTTSIASVLYGTQWAQAIEDIPDAFFVNYTVGEPILSSSAYHVALELASVSTIDDDIRQRAPNISTAPASRAPEPTLAPVDTTVAAQPDAPGYRTSTSGRFIRTDIVVDTDSFNPSDEELRTLLRIANNILVLRTDTEMRLGRIHRFSYRNAIAQCQSCPTGGVASGTVLTPIMDLYTNTTIPEPEFIVYFRGDDTSLTYGGYAASYESQSASYRNRFTSARGRTRDVYVSVSDWGHRYNICGYDRTDLRNPQHVSDVAINGECRNRPGTPCILQSGYWQCNDVEALASFYARDRYAFAAATAVHELMHQFGSDGNYDHYGSTRCPMPNTSDPNIAQTYAVICPIVFDLFRQSFHE